MHPGLRRDAKGSKTRVCTRLDCKTSAWVTICSCSVSVKTTTTTTTVLVDLAAQSFPTPSTGRDPRANSKNEITNYGGGWRDRPHTNVLR